MFFSRLLAAFLFVGAIAWMSSGIFTELDQVKVVTESIEVSEFEVAVETVRSFSHSRTLTLGATTQASKIITVVARGDGVVESLHVSKGALVAKDAPLVTLSDEGRRAAYESALALLNQKNAEFSARVKLIENGTVPALEKNLLEAEMAKAKAALERATLDMANTSIRAPMRGFVETLDIEVGQVVKPGQEISRIVNLDPMLAIAEIPEKLRHEITVGDEVTVAFLNRRRVPGRVSFIATEANPSTRTYRIEVSFSNPEFSVVSGETAEIAINLAPRKVSSVPRSALVLSSDGELGVRSVAIDDRVEFVEVEVVEDRDTQVFVAGIPSDTRVIVTGQDFVSIGQRVSVKGKE